MNGYLCISPDVKLGQNVKLSKFINPFGCEMLDETKVGDSSRHPSSDARAPRDLE